MSMRSIERTLGCSISTVDKLLLNAGHVALAYHDDQVHGVKTQRVQCDEVLELRTRQREERVKGLTGWRPDLRRSRSCPRFTPWKGISTGDFEEALAALAGKEASGLLASTVARLKEVWTEEHARWQKRNLSAKRYVYYWADGIHLEVRLEEQAQCILVIIGATPEGKKELVAFTDGMRESSQSWRDLLLDVKRRGLTTAPQIAVADGALGFWKALGEVWPTTREKRCWVHKTANILNKMPKSLHTKAKRALQEIWMAETKKDAVAALEAFVETYQIKYERAADCLTKDRDALLAFYDFAAEHWKHLRTTNPIESTFATVRHRTIRSKGCLSNKTALAMVFKRRRRAEKLAPHRRP
jgi:putative transposase